MATSHSNSRNGGMILSRNERSMPKWVSEQSDRIGPKPPPPPASAGNGDILPKQPSLPPKTKSMPEPDYEVIEFSNQQYSNAPIRPNSVSSGSKTPDNKFKCTLCGSNNPWVTCTECSQQIFCVSCDDMFHKHPKRKNHQRKTIEKSLPPIPPKTLPGQAGPTPPVAPPRRNKRGLMTPLMQRKDQGNSMPAPFPVPPSPTPSLKNASWQERFGSLPRGLNLLNRPLPETPKTPPSESSRSTTPKSVFDNIQRPPSVALEKIKSKANATLDRMQLLQQRYRQQKEQMERERSGSVTDQLALQHHQVAAQRANQLGQRALSTSVFNLNQMNRKQPQTSNGWMSSPMQQAQSMAQLNCMNCGQQQQQQQQSQWNGHSHILPNHDPWSSQLASQQHLNRSNMSLNIPAGYIMQPHINGMYPPPTFMNQRGLIQQMYPQPYMGGMPIMNPGLIGIPPSTSRAVSRAGSRLASPAMSRKSVTLRRKQRSNYIDDEATDDEDSDEDDRRSIASNRSAVSRSRQRRLSSASQMLLDEDVESPHGKQHRSRARNQRRDSIAMSVHNDWAPGRKGSISNNNRSADSGFNSPLKPSRIYSDLDSEGSGTRALVQAKIEQKLKEESLKQKQTKTKRQSQSPIPQKTSSAVQTPSIKQTVKQKGNLEKVEAKEIEPQEKHNSEIEPEEDKETKVTQEDEQFSASEETGEEETESGDEEGVEEMTSKPQAPGQHQEERAEIIDDDLGPPPSTPDHEWECEFCTFVNEPNIKICSICCKTPSLKPKKAVKSISPPKQIKMTTTVSKEKSKEKENEKENEKEKERYKQVQDKSGTIKKRPATRAVNKQSSLTENAGESEKPINHLQASKQDSVHNTNGAKDDFSSNPLKNKESVEDIWATLDENIQATAHEVTRKAETNKSSEVSAACNGSSSNSKSAIAEPPKSDSSKFQAREIGTSPPPQNISTQTYDTLNNVKIEAKEDTTSKLHATQPLFNDVIQESDLYRYTTEELNAALKYCGPDIHPLVWLRDNWPKLIQTVQSLSTKYGQERAENTIGTISQMEAREALRLHTGNIWQAVSECIEQRQRKYRAISSKGNFSREDVVTALTIHQGNVELALSDLGRNQLKPFLMRIWGSPGGVENESGSQPVQSLQQTYLNNDRDIHNFLSANASDCMQTPNESGAFHNNNNQMPSPFDRPVPFNSPFDNNTHMIDNTSSYNSDSKDLVISPPPIDESILSNKNVLKDLETLIGNMEHNQQKQNENVLRSIHDIISNMNPKAEHDFDPEAMRILMKSPITPSKHKTIPKQNGLENNEADVKNFVWQHIQEIVPNLVQQVEIELMEDIAQKLQDKEPDGEKREITPDTTKLLTVPPLPPPPPIDHDEFLMEEVIKPNTKNAAIREELPPQYKYTAEIATFQMAFDKGLEKEHEDEFELYSLEEAQRFVYKLFKAPSLQQTQSNTEVIESIESQTSETEIKNSNEIPTTIPELSNELPIKTQNVSSETYANIKTAERAMTANGENLDESRLEGKDLKLSESHEVQSKDPTSNISDETSSHSTEVLPTTLNIQKSEPQLFTQALDEIQSSSVDNTKNEPLDSQISKPIRYSENKTENIGEDKQKTPKNMPEVLTQSEATSAVRSSNKEYSTDSSAQTPSSSVVLALAEDQTSQDDSIIEQSTQDKISSGEIKHSSPHHNLKLADDNLNQFVIKNKTLALQVNNIIKESKIPKIKNSTSFAQKKVSKIPVRRMASNKSLISSSIMPMKTESKIEITMPQLSPTYILSDPKEGPESSLESQNLNDIIMDDESDVELYSLASDSSTTDLASRADQFQSPVSTNEVILMIQPEDSENTSTIVPSTSSSTLHSTISQSSNLKSPSDFVPSSDPSKQNLTELVKDTQRLIKQMRDEISIDDFESSTDDAEYTDEYSDEFDEGEEEELEDEDWEEEEDEEDESSQEDQDEEYDEITEDITEANKIISNESNTKSLLLHSQNSLDHRNVHNSSVLSNITIESLKEHSQTLPSSHHFIQEDTETESISIEQTMTIPNTKTSLVEPTVEHVIDTVLEKRQTPIDLIVSENHLSELPMETTETTIESREEEQANQEHVSNDNTAFAKGLNIILSASLSIDQLLETENSLPELPVGVAIPEADKPNTENLDHENNQNDNNVDDEKDNITSESKTKFALNEQANQEHVSNDNTAFVKGLNIIPSASLSIDQPLETENSLPELPVEVAIPEANKSNTENLDHENNQNDFNVADKKDNITSESNTKFELNEDEVQAESDSNNTASQAQQAQQEEASPSLYNKTTENVVDNAETIATTNQQTKAAVTSSSQQQVKKTQKYAIQPSTSRDTKTVDTMKKSNENSKITTKKPLAASKIPKPKEISRNQNPKESTNQITKPQNEFKKKLYTRSKSFSGPTTPIGIASVKTLTQKFINPPQNTNQFNQAVKKQHTVPRKSSIVEAINKFTKPGNELDKPTASSLLFKSRTQPRIPKKKYHETCFSDDDYETTSSEEELEPLEVRRRKLSVPVFRTYPNVQQESEDVNTEALIKKFMAEELTSTIAEAQIAAALVAMKFQQDVSIWAAKECSDIDHAIALLKQECELCSGTYALNQIVSMLKCTHKCCKQCAKTYFTVQITERSINDCSCPFCKLPELHNQTEHEDENLEYFSNLDIFLKNILEPEVHELFQRKLRDRTLLKDPNFKWCVQCSSGFFARPKQKRLICPDCGSVTCAQCRKPWQKQHEGISCDQFSEWESANDPEVQAKGVQKHLEQNGIDCPKCKFRYSLSRGGCMHFTCTQCKYEFCYGCAKPFMMGAKCTISPYCAKLGLHAHHPRNCLFYLRDKLPVQLQILLKNNGVPYEIDPMELPDDNNKDNDGPSSSKKKDLVCPIPIQKETPTGLVDTRCNGDVPDKHAGMCRTHYVEYLTAKVAKAKIDPLPIFDLTDCVQELRRRGIPLPERGPWDTDEIYKNMCAEVIQKNIPLDIA